MSLCKLEMVLTVKKGIAKLAADSKIEESDLEAHICWSFILI